MKTRLSTLWIFATLNYLYCDVISLMDHDMLKQYLAGRIGGVDVSQGFLLGAAVLVEIPMAMVLLTQLLNPRLNRWANIGAGAFMTVVQAATLFVRVPAAYYLFCSVIEIAATATVVWLAWRWTSTVLNEV